MQELIYQNFSTSRETLIEALRCEDYEEEGLLEMSQFKEAILTINEDIDTIILEYMIYFVLVRSESHEKL